MNPCRKTRIYRHLIFGCSGKKFSKVKDAGEVKSRLNTLLFNAFNSINNQGTITPSQVFITAGRPEFGDYQCNAALSLSKKIGKKPIEIANEVAKYILSDSDASEFVSNCSISGPGVVNFQLSDKFVIEKLCRSVDGSERYGVPVEKNPKKVIVDYSSPNIAKEMHVGHLRSTIIGDSLSRILEFLGHSVIRLNHVGDWGTQFGMLIYFLKTHHPEFVTTISSIEISENFLEMEKKIEAIRDSNALLSLPSLSQFYKEAKKAFDLSLEFQEASRLEVVKLQANDEVNTKLWQFICHLSRQEFNSIYSDLQIVGLQERGESFYNQFLSTIVQDLRQKNLAVETENAWGIFLPNQSNPFLIQKSDGGFLYATTDLAAVWHRCQVEKADLILYVTDAGQSEHFAMLFQAASLAHLNRRTKDGNDTVDVEMVHVPFGVVQGEDGKKFKSRDGDTVKLRDLLDRAVIESQNEMKRRKLTKYNTDLQPNLSDKMEDTEIESSILADLDEEELDRSRHIGLAAIKYADLSMARTTNYRFSYSKMLSMQGNTAPYMLYSYVRIQGILRKMNFTTDMTTLAEDYARLKFSCGEERQLAKQLIRYEEILQDITKDYVPHRLCDYIFDLSQKFNQFYESCDIIHENDVDKRDIRFILAYQTAGILKSALKLLGIDTISKM